MLRPDAGESQARLIIGANFFLENQSISWGRPTFRNGSPHSEFALSTAPESKFLWRGAAPVSLTFRISYTLHAMALPENILIVGGGVFGCESENPLWEYNSSLSYIPSHSCYLWIEADITQCLRPSPFPSVTQIARSPSSKRRPRSPTLTALPSTHPGLYEPTTPIPHTRNSQPKQLTSGAALNGAMKADTPKTAFCLSTPTETPRRRTTQRNPTTTSRNSVRTPSSYRQRQTFFAPPRRTAKPSMSQAAT